jgi:hypothetical protein
MRRGMPSECHANTALMFVRSKGAVRIAFGYALSDDGLWRQHSWGVDAKDGRVFETTERRVRYFGFVLEYPAAAVLIAMILGSGGFRPEDADEIRKVLVTVFRLPAELMDLADRCTASSRSRRRAARATRRVSPGEEA